MMKKKMMIAICCLATMATQAQEALNAYALTKPGVVVDYALYAAAMSKKPSLMAYVRTTVKAIQKDGDNDVVITNSQMLNRKKEPSKNAAFSGFADGIDVECTFTKGSYTIVQDPLFGSSGKIENDGFFLKIPAELKVGDKLESGSIEQTTKAPMGPKVHNTVSYDDFIVAAEEDVETPAGVFHCFRIDGKLNGSFQTVKLKDTRYSIWLSQNIGMVKVECDYYKESYVIDAIEGM